MTPPASAAASPPAGGHPGPEQVLRLENARESDTPQTGNESVTRSNGFPATPVRLAPLSSMVLYHESGPHRYHSSLDLESPSSARLIRMSQPSYGTRYPRGARRDMTPIAAHGSTSSAQDSQQSPATTVSGASIESRRLPPLFLFPSLPRGEDGHSIGRFNARVATRDQEMCCRRDQAHASRFVGKSPVLRALQPPTGEHQAVNDRSISEATSGIPFSRSSPSQAGNFTGNLLGQYGFHNDADGTPGKNLGANSKNRWKPTRQDSILTRVAEVEQKHARGDQGRSRGPTSAEALPSELEPSPLYEQFKRQLPAASLSSVSGLTFTNIHNSDNHIQGSRSASGQQQITHPGCSTSSARGLMSPPESQSPENGFVSVNKHNNRIHIQEHRFANRPQVVYHPADAASSPREESGSLPQTAGSDAADSGVASFTILPERGKLRSSTWFHVVLNPPDSKSPLERYKAARQSSVCDLNSVTKPDDNIQIPVVRSADDPQGINHSSGSASPLDRFPSGSVDAARGFTPLNKVNDNAHMQPTKSINGPQITNLHLGSSPFSSGRFAPGGLGSVRDVTLLNKPSYNAYKQQPCSANVPQMVNHSADSAPTPSSGSVMSPQIAESNPLDEESELLSIKLSKMNPQEFAGWIAAKEQYTRHRLKREGREKGFQDEALAEYVNDRIQEPSKSEWPGLNNCPIAHAREIEKNKKRRQETHKGRLLKRQKVDNTRSH